MPDQICQICKIPTTQSCSACGKVNYCTKEHQEMDWSAHKKSCAPYKILTNPRLGRHLVAIRDIQAGEVIMKKKPLILGPKMLTTPLCLGCHKKLDVRKPMYTCTQCEWPLCNENCESSNYHEDECQIFAKYNYKPSIKYENVKQSVYTVILPLRALLMKNTQADKFATILKHQSHLEEHRNTPVYHVLRRTLVNVLTLGLKIDTNVEEVLNLCSIFDTNTFEVRDTKGFINIRALFPMVSYVAHSCKRNTKHVFDDETHEMSLIATGAIEKNQMITTSYTQTLWGTLARRAHLKQSKNFDCVCTRCEDPSEFGTYTDSFYCTNCDDRTSKIVASNPFDMNSAWQCENCSNEVHCKDVILMGEFFKNQINSLDKSHPKYFEDFLENYGNILHPTNSYALQVKYALFQLYGNREKFPLEDIDEDILDRQIQLCRELRQVADVLEPGYSRFRGVVLFQLYCVLVTKCRKDRTHARITETEFKSVLEEASKILEECVKILDLEPDCKEILKSRLNIIG